MVENGLFDTSDFAFDSDKYSVWKVKFGEGMVVVVPMSLAAGDLEVCTVLVPKSAWGRLWRTRCIARELVIKHTPLKVTLDAVGDGQEQEVVDAVSVACKLDAERIFQVAESNDDFAHTFKTKSGDLSFPDPAKLRSLASDQAESESFDTPAEGVGDSSKRLEALETKLGEFGSLATALQEALGKAAPAAPAVEKAAASTKPASSVGIPAKALSGGKAESELQSMGLDRDQIAKITQLISPEAKLPPERPAKKKAASVSNLLGESDEESVADDVEVKGDPVVECLKQLTALTSKFAKQKKSADPLDLLLGARTTSLGGDLSLMSSVTKGPAAALKLKEKAFEDCPAMFVRIVENLMREANRTSTASGSSSSADERPCPYFLGKLAAGWATTRRI